MKQETKGLASYGHLAFVQVNRSGYWLVASSFAQMMIQIYQNGVMKYLHDFLTGKEKIYISETLNMNKEW